jgi:RNA polymerase sigma-70 factor, ECF subfamily
LLALILLTEARRPARTGQSGELITLRDQNRSLWDREMVEEGQAIVRRCIRRNRPGPYQFQAAIAAVHSDAAAAAETDWAQIMALYDQLVIVAPTPVVELNRAIALAESGDPAGALGIVEDIELDSYYLYHATRGDLLERLGCDDEAVAAFTTAAELTTNVAERRFLEQRAAAVRSR